jgi:hypothetical protein
LALGVCPRCVASNLKKSVSARRSRPRVVRFWIYSAIAVVLTAASLVGVFALRAKDSGKSAGSPAAVNLATPEAQVSASPSGTLSSKQACGKSCAKGKHGSASASPKATAAGLTKTPGSQGGSQPAAGNPPAADPPSDATGCVANPGSCGYPDASNTGIQAGVALTQVPSQATSGPGWHYSAGTVTVTGNVGSATTGLQLAPGDEMVVPDGVNNVTIDNVELSGLSGINDNGITIGTNTCQSDGCGPNNIAVENCYIHAVNDSNASVGGGVYITWQAKSIAVKNCDIAGAAGAIYYNEENGAEVTTGNYIHDPGASSASQHLNGIGSDAGPPNASSSWLIQDNTVLMTGPNGSQVTAPISLFPDFGPQVNVHATITGNLLDTGNYYLIDNGYGDAYGSSGQSYIAITNNRLGDSGNNYGVFNYTWYIAPNLPGCEKNVAVACTGDVDSGNIWDATGKSAD